MHNPEIRLECLKLAHRADKSPKEVIATAREYLEWVGSGASLNISTTLAREPSDNLKAGIQPRKKSSDKLGDTSSTKSSIF